MIKEICEAQDERWPEKQEEKSRPGCAASKLCCLSSSLNCFISVFVPLKNRDSHMLHFINYTALVINSAYYELNCVPCPPIHVLKSYRPVLQNVIIFGYRVCEEVINLKGGSQGGPLSHQTDVLSRRGNLDTQREKHQTHVSTERWPYENTGRKLSQRERFQNGANQADTLMLASSLQNCEEVNFCW